MLNQSEMRADEIPVSEDGYGAPGGNGYSGGGEAGSENYPGYDGASDGEDGEYVYGGTGSGTDVTSIPVASYSLRYSMLPKSSFCGKKN